MNAKNIRKHGAPPFEIVTVHGGPGAAGKMEGISKEISRYRGVAEAFQTMKTVSGQIQELHTQISDYCRLPVILIGHSWGAWLVFLFTSFYPDMVKKLILISAGPFEEKYMTGLMEKRLNRLTKEKKAEAQRLVKKLGDSETENKNEIFGKLGQILTEADSFQSVNHTFSNVNCRYDIYEPVWAEADELRKSGRLLHLAGKINCRVVAFHGDFDPHPAKGVQLPLQMHLKDFQFHLLKECGHTPWLERYAQNEFYDLLLKEILEEDQNKDY